MPSITESLTVRLYSKSDDLPCDHIEIHEMRGREEVSKLFEFDLHVGVTGGLTLDLDKVVGLTAALVFEKAGDEVRRLWGMVAEAHDLFDTEDAYTGYRLKLVPRAWELSMTSKSAIFMDLSVKDIIEEKLKTVALRKEGKDYEFRLLGTYPARDFVVQYQETDLAFVSRLAEHYGISLFFEHSSDEDKIVFADDPSGFHGPGGFEYTAEYRRRGEEQCVFAFQRRRQLVPARYQAREYSYQHPAANLVATETVEHGFSGGVVDFGANYQTEDDAKSFAVCGAQQLAARSDVYVGRSVLMDLSAGVAIDITDHPTANPSLMLVEVEHRASQTVAGRGTGEERSYRNRFVGIDKAKHFRPAHATPRPRIHGVLTGMIEHGVEEGIEELAKVDEDGSYHVKFLFETPPGDGRSVPSLPIRMIQSAAGANYGMHFPLRPGVEVQIAFVNGDPDRPVIVGATWNGKMPSPINDKSSTKNRLCTESGVMVEIEDGQKPK